MLAPVRGRDLVRFLFGECEQPIELRALRSATCDFFRVGDMAGMERFCRFHANADLGIFWGVATRDGEGGDLPHCRELPALFLEADRFDPECLARCPLPPSAVVLSGRPRGAHVYWKLREPLNLQTDATTARMLLRRLALHLDGDIAAAEPARVLRVVGTKNPKYRPMPTVSVAELRPDAVYNPGDFDEWLPTDTAVTAVGTMAWSLSEKLHPGNRNNTIYRLVRTLMLKDIPPSVIATVARTVNVEHSTNPLGETELSALMEHALRQPNRSHTRRITIEVPDA